MIKFINIIFVFFVLLGLQIVDFEFHEETNQISVIFRHSIGPVISGGGSSHDSIWKEVYGVKNGKIILLKKIQGELSPGRWIEEKITFDKLD